MRSEKVLVFAGLFLLILNLVNASCPPEFKDYGITLCDGSSSEINLLTIQYWCSNEGVWLKNGNKENPLTSSSLPFGEGISCYQSDTAPGSSSDCCPEGMTCSGYTLNGEEPTYYCLEPAHDDYVNKCEDITEGKFGDEAEAKCNRGYETIAEDEIELLHNDDRYCNEPIYSLKDGLPCYTARTCKCAWSESKNKCGTYVKQYGTCEDNPDGCIEIVESVDESGCEQPNGFAKYTITRTPFLSSEISQDCNVNNDASGCICPDEVIEVSCSKLTRLSFFSWFNLISVMIILGVFYLIKIKHEK